MGVIIPGTLLSYYTITQQITPDRRNGAATPNSAIRTSTPPSSIPQRLSCLPPWLWLWLLSWPVRCGWGRSARHLHELDILSRPFIAVASPISLLPGHKKCQERLATATTLELNTLRIQGKYQSRYGYHVRYWKRRFPRGLK